ncbi:MAG TPA: DUF29 domain-containing protein [Allosphingosinicella sp.]|nr:DUF29 domain-containing protein [Allosphingosinicella sp.]
MAEREHITELRRAAPGYEADYAAWLDHQVALLKADRWSEVDKDNLIDEVESLGRSEFRGFVRAFEIVIAHMLKWDFQPERRSNSWIASIVEHRERIEQELEDSPSYRARTGEALRRAWRPARALAANEINLPLKQLPAELPYSFEDVMNREHELGA